MKHEILRLLILIFVVTASYLIISFDFIPNKYETTVSTAIGAFIGALWSFYFTSLASSGQDRKAKTADHRHSLVALETQLLSGLNYLRANIEFLDHWRQQIDLRAICTPQFAHPHAGFEHTFAIRNSQVKTSALLALSFIDSLNADFNSAAKHYLEQTGRIQHLIQENQRATYLEAYAIVDKQLRPLLDNLQGCLRDAIDKVLHAIAVLQSAAEIGKQTVLDKIVFGVSEPELDKKVDPAQAKARIEEIRAQLNL